MSCLFDNNLKQLTMNQVKMKISGFALASAMIAASVQAADAPTFNLTHNMSISTYGYIAGAVDYTKTQGQSSDSRMDLTAAKLGFAFNFEHITGNLSFYTDRGADELYVLEANIKYDFENGFSVTAGRYQSWIGYEAFDVPNQNFLTFGTASVFGSYGIIPSFNEGVKAVYVSGNSSFGVSFTDSIYANIVNADPKEKYKGDGDLSNGAGVELHYGYSADALTLSATFAYEHSKTDAGLGTFHFNAYVVDIWAQYVAGKTTFGGELFYGQFDNVGVTGDDLKNYYLLGMVKQQLSEQWTLAGRASLGRGKADGYKGDFWKLSATPAYEVTKHLSVAAEVSYTHYGKDAKNNGKYDIYAGIQGVFKF